jgi:hypothetical protein
MEELRPDPKGKLVALILELRQAVKSMMDTAAASSCLLEAAKPTECGSATPPKADPNHVILELDTILDYKASLTKCKASADSVMNEVRVLWSGYFTTLDKMVQSYCPAGWQLHKDTLLENKEVTDALLNNPEYNKIGGVCEILKAMRKGVARITQDHTDLGSIIDPALLLAAKNNQSFGIITVTITYATYHLLNTVPQLANDDAKIRKCKEVKKAIFAKLNDNTSDVPKSIIDRIVTITGEPWTKSDRVG